MTFLRLLLVTVTLLWALPAQAEVIGEIVIETRILEPDPQPGMKSHHVITLDHYEPGNLINFSNSYKTGTTDLGFGPIESKRDKFKLKGSWSSLSAGRLGFSVIGETATGAGFLPGTNIGVVPSIDYRFTMTMEKKGNTEYWTLSGCHDGYPAYKVVYHNFRSMKSTVLYAFRHKPKNIVKLMGDCDVGVARTVRVVN